MVHNAICAKNSANAPTGMGPCSHSVAFSHYNNLSAQLPVDPETGRLVDGGARPQVEQCFKNIHAVLESVGRVMDDVVRLTVFLTDLSDLDTLNDVFRSYFPRYVPARTTVAVAALPLGALVQMEALVSNGEGTIPDAPQAGDLVKLARNTDRAPRDPLSTQTVAFSHYNNLSAQLPIDPASGEIVPGGAAEQARQCLENVKAILEEIGHVMDDVVKITLFATSVSALESAEEVYMKFFPDYLPALTKVPVAGLPMNALVQVEAVVSHGDGTPPQPREDARNIVIEASSTERAPQGPYSQIVAFSHYNHVAAQSPVDPQSGAIVPGGVKEQAAQCLKNIQAIVESADHTLEDVVKVNIYLKNIADMAAVDRVYTKFFPLGVPARRLVGVAALPGDALVQIDAVVANAEGTPPKA